MHLDVEGSIYLKLFMGSHVRQSPTVPQVWQSKGQGSQKDDVVFKKYGGTQAEQVVRDEQREHSLGHRTHIVTLLSIYPSIGTHLEEFESRILKSTAALQLRQVVEFAQE